eukprot:57549_1
MHYNNTDCTFNALYFELKDVANKLEDKQNIPNLWKRAMKDPCGTGISDIQNKMVRTAKGYAKHVVQSTPSRIIYRTMKNCSKLIMNVNKDNNHSKITIGYELVEAVTEKMAELFSGTFFNVDKLAGWIFGTYAQIDIDTRINVYHLLAVDYYVMELMCKNDKFYENMKRNNGDSTYNDLLGKIIESNMECKHIHKRISRGRFQIEMDKKSITSTEQLQQQIEQLQQQIEKQKQVSAEQIEQQKQEINELNKRITTFQSYK